MKVQDTQKRDVLLKSLVLDKRCQMRTEMNWIIIQEYADAMEAGDTFPPIVVYWKPGDKYYVADGFHRVHAARQLKRKYLSCEVRHGGLREAIIAAAGSNMHHGLRRTNADKRRSILAMLTDKEWRKWANAEIARRCGVSPQLVERVRETLDSPGPQYRLHYNGRGELQYRKTETKEELKERCAAAKKNDTNTCPYCGQAIAKG